MTNLNENISSLSSYKHDVLFNKYKNITLYKITNDILDSNGAPSLNNLLTLYGSEIDTNEIDTVVDNFKYRLTHQPKIYSITSSGYSNDSINEDYFDNIEKWLNKNSDDNNLKTFFEYRGSDDYDDINNENIQNYIFGSIDDYNLVPIRITAIENLSDITQINVNTLATIYKYLLRINTASGNLKTMLNSLRDKIVSLSDGFTSESDTSPPDISHIEKSLMNQATFKIVAKDGTSL